jgi:dTDP-4-amino-4,6-dideoxygalactose transaminase
VVIRVPFADLAAQHRETEAEVLAAIAGVARDASFILGPTVQKLEAWLAAACGVHHAVGVASGTDAVELGLRALGVGSGEAVVTAAVSFIAAAEAIVRVGARPVFCDVNETTMNADESSVGEAVDRARAMGLTVRAIVPVDLFGACAPVAALRSWAEAQRVFVLEDAAQAFGAWDDGGRPAGGGGHVAALSFFPTKTLGAWGDGGAVLTASAEVAHRVRRLRVHGATEAHHHVEVGLNSRLDALQAAVLLAKTPWLERWQAARSAAADRYLAELADLPLTWPHRPEPPARHAWHAFVVRTDRRDELVTWLRAGGIESRVYYPRTLPRQPCFASLHEPDPPVADAVCRTAVALPISPAMTELQQAAVIERVRLFFERPQVRR